ncbi:MAG: XRE family transcriptional regulator [Defluviitaleaceae bacterium]|nr:XRE family transcriptional regulator [Defluviitaleaceae bacterium]
MKIGDRIKQLRIQMDLTQEELANRSELSKGFISQVERDLNSPSISTLVDILECLGTNLKDFFNEDVTEKVVFGEEDTFVQDNEELSHTINWIIPNAQKNQMEPIIIKLRENGKSNVYNAHDGEIFGYVTQGSISLCIGNKSYKAYSGESFYYKANASHYVQNIDKRESIVLWVSTPPNF